MARRIAYWGTTSIVALMLLFAVSYLTGSEQVVSGFAKAGYPQHLRIVLGIVKPARHPLGIEDHGGGDDRTRERPAAGLVATGHRPDAAIKGVALARERRAEDLFAERQAGGSCSVETHRARSCAMLNPSHPSLAETVNGGDKPLSPAKPAFRRQ